MSGTPSPDIAVIIPFFQEEPGVLTSSLNSVLSQNNLDRVTIHIVDDGSPADPETELSLARARLGDERVVLHRKPNGGPGSARNHALDALRGDEYIAFLDSDDEWMPYHLDHVRAAAAAEADFYFADHRRIGNKNTRFTETGFHTGQVIGGQVIGGQVIGGQASGGQASGGRAIEPEGLHELTDPLFPWLLRRSPVGTSTVAYRLASAPALRFREDWRAAEDTLFWMELANIAGKIFFGDECEVLYGRGVSIFEGSTWGTADDLRRWRDIAAFHHLVRQKFPLDPAQADWNQRWLASVDRSFMSSFIGAVRHRESACFDEFRQFAAARPQALGHLFGAAWDVAKGQMTKQASRT